MNSKSKVLFPYNREPITEGSHLVICFHHAGGTGATFMHWNRINSIKNLTFVPVELPGHGYRRKESLIVNYSEMVRSIVGDIADMVADHPYSFYGHSMGAVLAFSVEYQLEQQYGMQAEKVIVAGRFAPMMEDPNDFRIAMGDSALLQEIIYLNPQNRAIYEDHEFIEWFLPVIRSDYTLHESFRYHGEVISASLVAHSGLQDVGCQLSEMNRWREVTTGKFKIKEFSGGHFFPHNLGKVYVEEVINEVFEK